MKVKLSAEDQTSQQHSWTLCVFGEEQQDKQADKAFKVQAF